MWDCRVDFYIDSARIVIELDGSQHYEDDAKKKDEERDNCLSSKGITVLRYRNGLVNTEFDAVCNDILKHLNLE